MNTIQYALRIQNSCSSRWKSTAEPAPLLDCIVFVDTFLFLHRTGSLFTTPSVFFVFCISVVVFFYFKTNIIIHSCTHGRHIHTSNSQVRPEGSFAHASCHRIHAAAQFVQGKKHGDTAGRGALGISSPQYDIANQHGNITT